MKLNADIVFDNLNDHISVEMLGRKESGLHLSRPRFYTGNGQIFEKDTLYIIRADKLPMRSSVRPGAVLVVVGDTMQLSFYKNRCCIIHVTDDTDIFNVFNLVQDIYNRYETLDAEIANIINTTAGIQRIVDVAAPVLGTDILILDEYFGVLAATENQAGTYLDLANLSTFLASEDLAMQRHDPISMTILDGSYLCQNIFVGEEYAGSVTFDYAGRRRLPSDGVMISYIADAISLAMRQLPPSESGDFGAFRNVIADLVDCVTVDQAQRSRLEKLGGKRRYVCVKMVLSKDLASLPYGYICSEMESVFPHSIAFAHGASIVGLICVDDLCDEDGGYLERLKADLEEFVEAVGVTVGISDAFTDLLKVRLYYDQAFAALVGSEFKTQDSRCYVFQDYAFMKLVLNAIGDLPLEMYFTDGMKRLVEHDREANVSYIETLRCYLANSMSIAKTAKALFIHRSTLLDRIGRIERELGCDLKNPDERLRIEILLKAQQIYDAMGS